MPPWSASVPRRWTFGLSAILSASSFATSMATSSPPMLSVAPPPTSSSGGFSVYKDMPTDEHYFGLGDKTGSFDRRNQAYTLWNTDIGIAGIDRPHL